MLLCGFPLSFDSLLLGEGGFAGGLAFSDLEQDSHVFGEWGTTS
jgi:hypothetical protein